MSLLKFISKDGYKDDSPDKNNPYNIIPSSNITMKGVSQPLYGIDELGNDQIMEPGGEYTFPGNYVMEIPMMQTGGESWEIDGIKVKLGNRVEDYHGKPQFEVVDDQGNVITYQIGDGTETLSPGIGSKPKGEGPDVPPLPKRPKPKPMAKVEPRGIERHKTMPTLAKFTGKGVKKLPDPTIIGYTQKWDSDNKKWIQEPEYQTIAEADANRYKQKGGIHIDPSKKGTFSAQATKMGMSTQAAASKILNAPEGKYSPAMRKKANFAKNFAKQEGGEYQDMELTDEQIAAYRAQGYRVDEL